MAGLRDIAPAVEAVDIRGTSVTVTGVSAYGIAMLLGRFPELRKLMSGISLDFDTLLALGGSVIAPIIAAGTGEPGDEEAEASAGRLTVVEQADFIEPILRLTFPEGIGPFVERLSSLSGSLGGGAASPRAQDTKSRRPSKP